MKYSIRHRHFAQTLVIGISIAFLSGCMRVPGMHFDDRNAVAKSAKGAPAVAPIIKAITHQLIQQEQQLALAITGIHTDLSEIMELPLFTGQCPSLEKMARMS